MNTIKQCLIVVGDVLDPTPIYKNGYNFLSRCGMHFVSLSKRLYSIYCDNTFKNNPTYDDVVSLTQCSQFLINSGEQYIKDTNKAITKYIINEGLKYYAELIKKNSYNFKAQNLTSDAIYLNYSRAKFVKFYPMIVIVYQ